MAWKIDHDAPDSLLSNVLVAPSALITSAPRRPRTRSPGQPGDRAVRPPAPIDDISQVLCLASGDLDNDGLQDVIVGSWFDDRMYWHRSLGNGTFEQGLPFPMPANFDSVLTISTGDLDGDADTDLLVGMSTFSQFGGPEYSLYQLTNDGGGTFSLAEVGGLNDDNPLHTELADVDGDGALDLLFLDDGTNGLYLRHNPGNGAFSQRTLIAGNILRGGSLRAVDLNGDGALDILLGDQFNDRVIWFANDGNGGFGSLQVVATGINNTLSVDAADLDGDGDNDVLMGSIHQNPQGGQINGQVTWFENLGNGVFGPENVLYSVFPGGSFDVHTVDMDGDGRTDILHTAFDRVLLYRSLGAGQFGPGQEIDAGTFDIQWVLPQDFDGDGDRDIVVGTQTQGTTVFVPQLPSAAATGYCDGSGGAFACPCQNTGGSDSGCANSTGQGVSIAWFGSASVAADDFAVQAHGGPANVNGLLLEGTAQVSLPVMDGQLCTGGATRRLRIFQFDGQGAASISYNLASLSGNLNAQDVRHYQVWYRDPVMGPCGNGGNLSNAMTVTWGS